MKNRGKRTLAIWALAISLCVTTIAYAVLSTTLKISGTVTKKGGTWDIQFTDVAWVSGVALTKVPSTSGTNLNFSVTLSKPGDYTIIKFKVTNNGSINAYYDHGSLSVGSSTSSVTTDGFFSALESEMVYCWLSSNDGQPSLGYYEEFDFCGYTSISANSSSEDYLYLKCAYYSYRDDLDELPSTDATVDISLSLFYSQYYDYDEE